jgi:trigger factor
MESQISEISSVLVEISVQVPWGDVEKALEGTYSRMSKTASVKGFRPGKVPRNVLKQVYGPRVKQEVVSNLVEAGLGKAVEKHQLTVVSVPPLEQLPELKQGEPLAFTAKLEVRPKIENVDISGLALTRNSSAVADADVDAAIERLRQGNAELAVPEPMRPAKEGDILTCDYSVAVEGVERADLSAQGRAIELGGGLLPELRDGLLGKQPGETAEVDVTFPAEESSEFSGKSGHFSIQVKELKEKVLPDLDDEFAKDLDHASLDELKQKTRERLEAAAKERAESELRDQVIDKLVEKNPIELPPSLVAQQQQALLEEYVRMLRVSGQRFGAGDDFVQNMRMDAERRVRAALLMGAIARKQQLKIEAADVDKKFDELAHRTGKHVAKLRAEIQGEQRQMLESQILEEKLLEYLLGQATITEATG